jgi:CheY-like chemotaxis protein
MGLRERVLAFGGTLEAKGEEGKGTRISISIRSSPHNNRSSTHELRYFFVFHGRAGAPVKVLIADDHPVVRQGLKLMMSADPEIDVVGEARDGDEAFDMAHQVDWDVAVFDYSMPGRGGVELLSDVKTDYPDRPVLILSIYPEDPHGLRALKAGAAGYISKETAGDELTAAVKKAASGGAT